MRHLGSARRNACECSPGFRSSGSAEVADAASPSSAEDPPPVPAEVATAPSAELSVQSTTRRAKTLNDWCLCRGRIAALRAPPAAARAPPPP